MSNLDHHFFLKALNLTGVGIVVTDPSLKDNPIIYANQGLVDLTLYTKEEIIGHNCRFLQGKDTDPNTVLKIKHALKKREHVRVEILNYKKDGTPFWNDLTINPIKNDQDGKIYFVGIQKDISKQKNIELDYLEALEEVKTLACPLVPLVENMAVMPLIGKLTEDRFSEIFNTVTKEVVKNKIHVLLVDVSGLNEFNEEILIDLVKLYEVLNLLGTELVLTGITTKMIIQSEDISMISSSSIKTYQTVQDFLLHNRLS